MTKRFSEEQIIAVPKEQDASINVKDLFRKHRISEQTYYPWKSRYGGMAISQVKPLRPLEAKNGKLKKLLAESMLDNAALKDVDPPPTARPGHSENVTQSAQLRGAGHSETGPSGTETNQAAANKFRSMLERIGSVK